MMWVPGAGDTDPGARHAFIECGTAAIDGTDR